jgi:hypothetical protein
MESKKLAAPIIALLCILTAMLVMAPRGLATAQTTADPLMISMTPDNGTGVQGLFNVTILLSGSTTSNIGGAQIYISFNDSIVNATRWFVPMSDPTFFMPSTPAAATALPSPPDPGYVHLTPGNGRIQVSVLKGGMPPTAPWGHTGLICIIEFNVTGNSQGQTIQLHMYDPTNTFLVDEASAIIPDVVINDGSYPIVPEFQVEYALLALIGLTVIAIAIRKKAFPKAVVKSL